MEKVTNGLIVFIEFAVFGLVGIIFLWFGIKDTAEYIESKKTIIDTDDDYELVSGKVTKIENHKVRIKVKHGYSNVKVDDFDIIYKDKDGNKHNIHTNRYRRNSTTKKLKVGGKVRVLYSKEYPEEGDIAYFDILTMRYAPMKFYIGGFGQTLRSIAGLGGGFLFLFLRPWVYFTERKEKKKGKMVEERSFSKIREKRGLAFCVFFCFLFITLVMIIPISQTIREYAPTGLNELPKMMKDTELGALLVVAVIPTMVSFLYWLLWCVKYHLRISPPKKKSKKKSRSK